MLNPSIPLGVRDTELPNPLELQQGIQQARTARRQGRMSDLLLAGAERDNAKAMETANKERTIKGLLQVNTEAGPDGAPGLNKGRMMADLGKLGYAQEALDMQAQSLADQVAAKRAKRQEFTEKLGLMGQILGGHNPQNYPMKYAALKALGFDESDGIPDPSKYDPNMIEGALKQGLTYKERLELEDKQEKTKSDATVKNRELDQKDRELDIRAKEKPPAQDWEKMEGESGVYLYNKKTGEVRSAVADGQPIQGKKKEPKPPTEAQSNSALYGRRVEQAMADLDGLVAKGFKREGGINGALDSKLVPNFLTPDDLQSQQQAERNFINAVLRKESGASISPSEFSSAEKQYFPRNGDSKQVLEQKARNRAQVREGFRSAAGGAWEQVAPMGVAAPTQPGPGAIAPGSSSLKPNQDGSFDYVPGGQ